MAIFVITEPDIRSRSPLLLSWTPCSIPLRRLLLDAHSCLLSVSNDDLYFYGCVFWVECWLYFAVCAISSRFYSKKSEIYPIAMHFAKHSAANALIDGWKSVELCQAYILMSIYAVPARRWEEDRSWLYTGLAIRSVFMSFCETAFVWMSFFLFFARIATDLNLHHVPTTLPKTEKQEREVLNKTRVWMVCFNLDRSTATQFGKPSTIKEDLYVIRFLFHVIIFFYLLITVLFEMPKSGTRNLNIIHLWVTIVAPYFVVSNPFVFFLVWCPSLCIFGTPTDCCQVPWWDFQWSFYANRSEQGKLKDSFGFSGVLKIWNRKSTLDL